MSPLPNFTRKWNEEVKPVALALSNECQPDRQIACDIKQMIEGVDHALDHDQLPHSHLETCLRRLSDDKYFEYVRRNIGPEWGEGFKDLGALLGELSVLDLPTET